MTEAAAPVPDDLDVEDSPIELPEEAKQRQGFELHKNGTVTVFMNEERAVLRRPKVGEFRLLREKLEQAADEQGELALQIDADTAEQRERMTAKTDSQEDRRFVIKRQRELRDVADRGYVDWMAEALQLLGSGVAVNGDDLPQWMATSGAVTQLVKHWQAVPSPRGVR